MAYYFGVDLRINVFVKESVNLSGQTLPWSVIARAETFSDEEKSMLPDMIRVEAYGRGEPIRLPLVLKRSLIAGCLFFSEDIKALLDELEPGVHEFRPVEVRVFPQPAPELDVVLATYYLWVSPPELQAVIPESSAYQAGIGLQAREDCSGLLSSNPDSPCVLRASAIRGRHCWREIYRMPITGADGEKKVSRTFSFFCSAEFYSRVKFSRLEGFDFIKKCEVRQ